MKVGDAFYVKYLDNHIWVVAHQTEDTIIIFNFSSWKEWQDHACCVKPNEYSELRHISVVVYGGGQPYIGKEEIRNLNSKIERFIKPVSPEVLARIINGATISETISQKLQKYFLPKKP